MPFPRKITPQQTTALLLLALTGALIAFLIPAVRYFRTLTGGILCAMLVAMVLLGGIQRIGSHHADREQHCGERNAPAWAGRRKIRIL